MAHFIHHPSDEALLRAIDGEHSPRRLTRLERHLADCEPCRDRRQKLRATRDDFLRACREDLTARTPASDRLRERVQTSLTTLSKELDGSWSSRFAQTVAAAPRVALVAAALVVLVAAAAVLRHRPQLPAADDVLAAVEPGVLPVRSLTPGATRRVQLDELCGGRESDERPISPAVRQAVLRDYRMEEVPAHEYELDYLITPELGGSGDRRNLWPERYGARVWNARVKDELEQLLPRLVCRGEVDLATAQRDIAANWIAAYKKYFHTDGPVRTSNGAVPNRGNTPTLVSLVTRAASIESRPW